MKAPGAVGPATSGKDQQGQTAAGAPGARCEQCGSSENVRRGGEFVTIDGVTRVKRLFKCSRCWGTGHPDDTPRAA